MKNIAISSALAALLLLSGCSSKSVSSTSDADLDNSGSTEVIEEVVVIDDSGAVDINENSMSALEDKLGSVYFDFDKFNVKSDMQPVVEGNSNIVNDSASEFMIKLEGNCDEWGSDEYNYALGLKRTKATKDDMIANGVSSDRISMMSYGKSNPVCSANTKDCWSQNRRVDFKLLP
ncbi:MAG: OmpA family protein [Campylobacterota bacterium]|nr:OmpA family protein [Campylobacterota bacterium]